MNNLGNIKPPGNSKKASNGVNPFARALAESEKGAYAGKKNDSKSGLNPFGEALARTGGQLPKDLSPQDLQKQQEELEAQRKKAEMRKKLHDQINPVDQTDIFSARRERTKKELEEVRKELKNLAREIGQFYKEVDVQVSQEIVEQGIEGVGLKTYFEKLKAFIILLTQKVRSARTWMQQQQAKSKKKKRKIRGGVMIEGKGAQETKEIFDMMHHERSSAYSGG